MKLLFTFLLFSAIFSGCKEETINDIEEKTMSLTEKINSLDSLDKKALYIQKIVSNESQKYKGMTFKSLDVKNRTIKNCAIQKWTPLCSA